MIREFKLSPPGSGRGVSCDAKGAFIGPVPLLKRHGAHGVAGWEPRNCSRLSKQISYEFGFPIDFSSKMGGLKAIANALNAGDIARAQVAAVLLAIPDHPPLTKGVRSHDAAIKFIRDLHWNGLIKWNGNGSHSPSADLKSSAVQGDLAKAGYNPAEHAANVAGGQVMGPLRQARTIVARAFSLRTPRHTTRIYQRCQPNPLIRQYIQM